MKPGAPSLQSTRLLDQVHKRVRYLHYSLKTEKAYLYWIRFFIRWSAAQTGNMRHPREMGVVDAEAFFSMLANERKVSASNHNQALSAVLFLYREVLGIDLPWLNNIGWPQQAKRIPSVLTKGEVAGPSVDPRTAVDRRNHLFEERLQSVLKKTLASAGVVKPVSVHNAFAASLSAPSMHHNLTGIPRSRIRSLACCTVYSP